MLVFADVGSALKSVQPVVNYRYKNIIEILIACIFLCHSSAHDKTFNKNQGADYPVIAHHSNDSQYGLKYAKWF